jgi:hypothetical protein
MHSIIREEMDRMRDRVEAMGLGQTAAGHRLYGHLSRLSETATWDDLDAMFALYCAALRDTSGRCDACGRPA